MTANSYPVQRHVPVTFNMEVPPPRVTRQLPLNTVKKKTRIEKPTCEVCGCFFFFFTRPVFHWFFANVNACSPLTGISWVFGGTWPSAESPAGGGGGGGDVLRTTYGQMYREAAHAHHLRKNSSAVYTGIKKTNLSRIRVFCWKLLGNFP